MSLCVRSEWWHGWMVYLCLLVAEEFIDQTGMDGLSQHRALVVLVSVFRLSARRRAVRVLSVKL